MFTETKEYLFNPFNIHQWQDETIADRYKEVQTRLNDNPNSMYEYAMNIETLANMNYLIGEMVARYKQRLTDLKNTIKINEAKRIYYERDNWVGDGKTPAMEYFKALATDFIQDDLKRLSEYEVNYLRFKTAYETNEQRQNALKKKLEAVKFEEFNQ